MRLVTGEGVGEREFTQRPVLHGEGVGEKELNQWPGIHLLAGEGVEERDVVYLLE